MLGYYVMFVNGVVLPGDDVVRHCKFSLCLWVSQVASQWVCGNCFISNTGLFGYMLVMTSEASVKYGTIGVSCNFWSRSVMLFTLNVALLMT